MKKYQHWFESSVICSIVCFNYKVLRWVCWLLCVAEHFLMTEMICALCFQRESPSWWRRHGSIRKLTKNIFNLGWKEERASNLEVGQGYKLSKTIFTVVLYKDLCARDTKLPEQHLHLGTTCSNTWASVDIYHSITEGDNIGTRETLVTRQHMRYKFASLCLLSPFPPYLSPPLVIYNFRITHCVSPPLVIYNIGIAHCLFLSRTYLAQCPVPSDSRWQYPGNQRSDPASLHGCFPPHSARSTHQIMLILPR